MGLHICSLVPRGTDGRGEYVQVANDGSANVTLTGLELTDYTASQQRVHIYTFPPMRDGSMFVLKPKQSVFVFTGKGTNTLSSQGDWLVFAGRAAPVWNNTGDVAYLRNAKGQFIDTMTVGSPARHPNGH